MSVYDGGVLGVTEIHRGGPTAERFNIAVFAEGYRFDQLDQYAADAKDFVDRLVQTPPFDKLRCSINVFRVDVWSVDSGADDPYLPPYCFGSNVFPRTFFDATFCAYGIERLLWVDSATVEYVRNYFLPEAHEIVILVNSAKEGGSGDKYATVTNATSWDWAKVAIHELGHALGLGDEYDFLTACDDDNRTYQGPEPAWPNVALDVTRDGIKWADLVDPTTPLPTFSSPDCDKCYNGPTGHPAGTVGAFEGAGLYHCGLYRAEADCLMRYADDFCVVCAGAIRAQLATFRPTCLAPVFEPGSKLVCLFKKFALAFLAMGLSLVSWHRRGDCALRRVVFVLQHCDVGNDDPCIELGGSGGGPTYEVTRALPRPPQG